MPAGGIHFGHFVLHRRLARGGMAEVFLARQRGLEGFDRRVAVKRILPHLSERPDFVQMFLDEARLAARLSHPNIVHIYEFGKVDDDYFIAMEYVEGVHAGQLIKLAGKEQLPAVVVARIGADAASALAYAHRLEDADGTALSVVHRDISPQNIMISFDGVVKLVDFGIAKAAAGAGEGTRPGVVKGKYAYMSPEQTVGKPLDGRSDVFSLALVLWELLTGKNVVDRGDPAEGMRAIRDGRFPAVEQVAPWVPAPLAAAIGQALEVDRDQRATAAELGVALEAYIKASPELATAMQVSDWVRARFARTTTGSLPAVEGEPGRRPLPPPRTQVASTTAASSAPAPVTRATSMSTPVTEGTAASRPWTIGSAAVALPVRSATIMQSSIEAAAAPAAVDPDAALTTPRAGLPALDVGHADPLGPGAGDDPFSGEYTIDDATALVGTRPRLVGPPAPRRRRRGAWLVVAALVVGAGATAAALTLSRGGAAPGDATGGVATAAATVDAAPPAPPAADAAPPAVVVDAAPALAAIDVLTTPPGATARLVGLDGPELTTPATFVDLEPGTVELVVERDGHEPLTRTLTLAPGERRTLELVLTPVAVVAREPDHNRPRDRDRRRPPPPARTGTLNVRTNPYSVVYADGKKLGETPFVRALPAGTYTLTFVNPDHGKVTRRVTIKADQTTKVKFDL